eukprot:3754394-Rhodomonas_salina.1
MGGNVSAAAGNVPALHSKGSLLAMSGDEEAGLALFEEALRLVPDDEELETEIQELARRRAGRGEAALPSGQAKRRRVGLRGVAVAFRHGVRAGLPAALRASLEVCEDAKGEGSRLSVVTPRCMRAGVEVAGHARACSSRLELSWPQHLFEPH